MIWTWLTIIAAVLCGPVLAGWYLALAGESTRPWWMVTGVSIRSALLTGGLAALLTGAASGAQPIAAWWLFSCGGAVLILTDLRVHRLPARFVYPLASAIAAGLTIESVVTGSAGNLLRALAAAALVGLLWFLVAFASPTTMGLGDVRVAALAAGVSGWTSWTVVLQGQVCIFLVAGLTAIALMTQKRSASPKLAVPMGPALVVGTIVATWF